jgi:hypothetical protein
VPAPTVTLTASPTGIVSGAASTLTWTSTNATTCTASGGTFTGTKTGSGNAATGALTANTMYTLACTGPGGSGSGTATVNITASSSFVVTPRTAALTTSQKQQFTAAVTAGDTATWTVDSIAGGNTTVGTVDSTGLYTPPATPGVHTVLAASAADNTKGGVATVAVTDLAGVYTFHNDQARTGQNLQEYALTPSALTGGSFGKRWSCAVSGGVFAQPLYVANLAIGGGTHNILIVVTQTNMVYALDADDPTCKTYWAPYSAMNTGEVPVTYTDLGGCNDIASIGITGTPVIDPATNILYFVTKTKAGSTFHQRLHALNIATGIEQANSPREITATVPGTGQGGSTVSFSPEWSNQRPGLAFSNGSVYVAWASHCDSSLSPWWGWVMKFDAALASPIMAFNVAPNGTKGGIWMSAGAPAFDATGSMFLSTGNGDFSTASTAPAPANTYNFSMSFLNMNPATLTVQDFYTPTNEATWSSTDADIASGGVVVLPDGVGPPADAIAPGSAAHPNLLFGADKQSHIWLLDRTNLGQFVSPMNGGTDSQAVQYLTLPGATTGSTNCHANCMLSTPAYYNQTVYLAPAASPLMAFKLNHGLIPVMLGAPLPTSSSTEAYPYPGVTPVVSASPAGNAIVWTLDDSGFGNRGNTGVTPAQPAVLRAYNASDLTTLYDSSAAAHAGADAANGAVKFTNPVVANGHVYVAGVTAAGATGADTGDDTHGQVTVYGLAP